MAGIGLVTEVEFHSRKDCFVLLDCCIPGVTGADKLSYFEIRQCNDETKPPIYAAGYPIPSSSNDRSTGRPHVLINGIFANVIGIKLGDRVLITPIAEPRTCSSVIAEPLSSDDWEVVSLNAEKIEEQLLSQVRLVYAGMEFPFWVDRGYCIFLRLESCECGTSPFGLLAEATEVVVAQKTSSRIDNKTDNVQIPRQFTDTTIQQDPSLLLFRGVKYFDSILDKLSVYSKLLLSEKDPIFLYHPLLVGTTGSGKTMAAKAFCSEMKTRGLIAHFSIMECKLLKGKTVESVEKRLKERISEAIEYEPSVIVLDDLEQLCSCCSTMDQLNPGTTMLFERMSRMLGSHLRNIGHHRHRILFLATCTSTKALNQHLISPRGFRYFDTVAEIPQLDMESRKAVIVRLIEYWSPVLDELARCNQAIAWAAKRTEGYVIADLAMLVERALLAHEESGENSSNYLTVEDFKTALDGFIPINIGAAIKQTTTHTDATISMDSIGGLGEAKAILEKMLLLPAKYPKVFGSLSIRLPRGVLLYGPSGCGKTMMAAAVANDYHLNLIHVKGAELLSKYIGASEQAVRDTFQRAKAMKPSLVVFDEFDALAPRRGHDSTGVTDRVVNQLLTEMDGVESLEGVFVLAASSRPDLIDPALLRPGRIDKRVYCGIPNEAERLDILNRRRRPLHFDRDVKFSLIVNRTEGFTGADLKTLLLDSYLLALRHNKDGTGNGVKIKQEHVLQALAALSPSVTGQERKRLERMYENFRSDRDEQAMTKLYQENVGKRATLA